ncbi:GTP cyclohydrolase I FolE [Candidatus Erwinia haradaeae]|uniref:GTP cyclohydrolase 1 n=1 Tax=Candidatus Erwinia haradaeae TaxID=1922217 RepID=A0A803FTX5_9GAMM|nr:GTP cyclohydrolase I FolE [Candidatus Erwinia haradaeae]VFP88385.1 GTP cyclohydrolase 1 [Candidatus Erwinia haradaeae]
MPIVSSEAKLIHQALVALGLEAPLQESSSNINHHTRKELITHYVTKILEAMRLDTQNNSLMDTPKRIANMYMDEVFSGLNYSNFPKITLIKNNINMDEIVTTRNIAFTSICEHHFMIIDGHATVSYIPKDTVIGLSKINRIVHFFSSRPQLQERLIQQIMVALQILLNTCNVAVSIQAIHYCVKARGIRDKTSVTTTTSLGGLFKSNQQTRQEFLQLAYHN